MRNGTSQSCGCESARKRGVVLAAQMTKHGHATRKGVTSTYQIYRAMLQRCNDTGSSGYMNYGGRGIRVCDRWQMAFANFLTDMGERPSGLSLGRIDNDGDYCPENCRWETKAQQYNNTTKTIRVRLSGSAVSLMQACVAVGFNYDTAKKAMRTGRGLHPTLIARGVSVVDPQQFEKRFPLRERSDGAPA